MQHERRRRLAARAGDREHVELGARVAEEGDRGRRHRRTRIPDDELRHWELERPLDEKSCGAARDGVRGEVVAVGARAAHADEESARPDRVGPVGHVGDLDGVHLADDRRRRDRIDEHPQGPAHDRPPALTTSPEMLAAPFTTCCDADPSDGNQDCAAASGATPRYGSAKRAISANAGAATVPP